MPRQYKEMLRQVRKKDRDTEKRGRKEFKVLWAMFWSEELTHFACLAYRMQKDARVDYAGVINERGVYFI